MTLPERLLERQPAGSVELAERPIPTRQKTLPFAPADQ